MQGESNLDRRDFLATALTAASSCQTLRIRQYDALFNQESRRYFAERKVVLDWSDSRISVP